MIEARKVGWFRAWFARHAEGRIRAHFSVAHVSGLERLTAPDAPTLVVSNHQSWWDPLVAIWLVDRLARLDGYAMMDARNLARLPFFRRVGAFGVALDSPEGRSAALRYAGGLLDRPARLVWIFPQGRELPGPGPLAFRPGAAVLSQRLPGARVLPVALAYAHLGREAPELFVHIGPPLPNQPDVEAARLAQESAVQAGIEAIGAAWRAGPDAYAAHGLTPLFRRDEGWLQRAMTRALCWFTRN